MDLYPNRYTGYTFKTPALMAGQDYQDHWIFCAEYCGDLHSEMAAILRVVPKPDYGEVLVSWNSDDLSPIELGQRVAAGRCYTCHSIDGSAMTGPTWLNLYGYEQPMADGTQVLADEDYLRESILVPGAKIHAGYANQMPSFQGQLSEAQLEGLIQYMRSLSDKWEGDAAGEGAEGEGAAANDEAGETSGDGDDTAEPADDESDDDTSGDEVPASTG
jgi:cytochrome c oxidase subunit 2